MKKIYSLLASAGIAIIATGCASTHVSKVSGPMAAVTKTVVATPDVVIGEKISGEATLSTLFGVFDFGSTKYADGIKYVSKVEKKQGGMPFSSDDSEKYSEAKAAAAYDACQKNGADLLLVPNYQVETKNILNIWRVTHCKVSGFKGVVKKISKIEYKTPIYIGKD